MKSFFTVGRTAWIMEVYRDLKTLKGKFAHPAITLGNFDGVHLGHKEIFTRIRKRAAEIGGEALIFTFDPHPVKVLRPDTSPSLITPLDEKLRLFEREGIDGVILADFTKEFAAQHPAKFVENLLFRALAAELVVVGHDFTFGKGKEGTIGSLKDLGAKLGFQVEVVKALKVDGEVVSSTRIRELIQGGDVRCAKRLLGRCYSINGKVVKGHSRGRALGFPTANLDFHGELSPKNGVYAVKVRIGEEEMTGVANVGTRPTFGDRERSFEVHIFDFDGSLYGRDVRLFFIDRIRDELFFTDTKELSAQIGRDVIKAREILGREGP